MKLLTQNSKMKITSKLTSVSLFNFGIPAFKSETGLTTCPNASRCAVGCYARTGTYRFKKSIKAYEERLAATLRDDFALVMAAAIKQKLKRNKKVMIRIHDSGDFYNESYLMTWCKIMDGLPEVKFYAYTKQVSLMKKFKALCLLPENFTIIYSYGGKEDALINTWGDRHSLVFETNEQLKAAGYVNTTENDMNALGKNKRIGLVYHGVKSYKNTSWDKVITEKKAKGLNV